MFKRNRLINDYFWLTESKNFFSPPSLKESKAKRIFNAPLTLCRWICMKMPKQFPIKKRTSFLKKRLIDEAFRANICVCFVVSSRCVVLFFNCSREAKRKEDEKNRPTGHICQYRAKQKDLYEKFHLWCLYDVSYCI